MSRRLSDISPVGEAAGLERVPAGMKPVGAGWRYQVEMVVFTDSNRGLS